MLDDLCFYITTHESLLQINIPDNLEVLVHKIIASRYVQHMVFINMAVSRWQWTMFRHNDIESWLNTSNPEAQWSDVQALARYIAEYCEDLKFIMLQAGIPLVAPDTSQPRAWRDVTPGYQFLYSLIGLMFLPLAFISSLFSMVDDYLPGHAKFWL
jgi:hypothetical protein